MAKARKRDTEQPDDNNKTGVEEGGIISGAVDAIGSIVGAMTAATDFVSTQVTGEPVFATGQRSQQKRAANKVGTKATVSGKASGRGGTGSVTAKASAKRSGGNKGTAKKSAKSKAGVKERGAKKAGPGKTHSKKSVKGRGTKSR